MPSALNTGRHSAPSAASAGAPHRGLRVLFGLLCALVALSLAVAVRAPAVLLMGVSDEQLDAYVDANGDAYLQSMDSYYHLRIAGNLVDHGTLGDAGTDRDMASFWPEGREVDDQPGIAYLAAAAHRAASAVAPVDLRDVAVLVSLVLAALAALAAFGFACRMSNAFGGSVAGVLVACSTAFVGRSQWGSFDSDVCVCLFSVLCIWLFCEAVRARTWPGRVAGMAGFAAATGAFSVCWISYALVFPAIAVAGFALYLVVLLVARRPAETVADGGRAFRRGPALLTAVLGAAFAAAAVIGLRGTAFVSDLVDKVLGTAALTDSGELPNLYESVTELSGSVWLYDGPGNLLAAYVPGEKVSVLGGVGGIAAAVLALAGLLWLAGRCLGSGAPLRGTGPASQRRRWQVLCLCVLVVWLAVCLYAVSLGSRFIELLAAPAGILSGACAGWLTALAGGSGRRDGSVSMANRAARALLALVIVAVACGPALYGSARLSKALRPSETDAAAQGMQWVRDHAESDEACIASWWDEGFFFEWESGHPALWDGGSQYGRRAVLVGRALATDDPRLSRALLVMLATSGDAPSESLTDALGVEEGFSTLFEILVLPADEARAVLVGEHGLDAVLADEVVSQTHPAEPAEVHVVLTDRTMRIMGWVERYGLWSFGEPGERPSAVAYDTSYDGAYELDSDDPAARAYFEQRSHEVMWRLFFDGDGAGCFEREFAADDGVHSVQVWRVV